MSVPANLFVSVQFRFIIGLIGFASVNGCGQFPQGQVNAIAFTASGFTLPAEMAYSETPEVQNGITSISRNKNAAVKIVYDLIMNAVNDVLQEQGRNALLPDAVIQLILQQLNVTIDYTPLECKTATKDPTNPVGPPQADTNGCLIIENVVVGTCTMIAANCKLMPMVMNVMPTSAEFRTVKGNIRTSNVLMANWSKQMWQSVLNRVFQRIQSGQFEKYFSTAIIAVNN